MKIIFIFLLLIVNTNSNLNDLNDQDIDIMDKNAILILTVRQLEYILSFLEDQEKYYILPEDDFNYFVRNDVYNYYKNISISYNDIINEHKNMFDLYNINLVSILISINNIIEQYLQIFMTFLIRSDIRLNNYTYTLIK